MSFVAFPDESIHHKRSDLPPPKWFENKDDAVNYAKVQSKLYLGCSFTVAKLVHEVVTRYTWTPGTTHVSEEGNVFTA